MIQHGIKGLALHLGMMVCYSGPLFWFLVALRNQQAQFARSLNEPDTASIWSFGQIVVVVVFFPVLSELFSQRASGTVAVRQIGDNGRSSSAPSIPHVSSNLIGRITVLPAGLNHNTSVLQVQKQKPACSCRTSLRFPSSHRRSTHKYSQRTNYCKVSSIYSVGCYHLIRAMS